MTEFEKLVERVRKTAKDYGGLLSLLLAVQSRSDITFSGSYFFVKGKQVETVQLQKELGRIELRIAAKIASYNEKLWNKEWTLSKWRAEMSALVETNHYLFGALALGNIVRALKNDTVKRHIDRDKKAVVRFSQALRNKQVPSLPLAQNRGRAYIRSFAVTYQLLDQKAKIDAGLTEAKRILTPAEHCRTELKPPYRDGCFEVAAQGWLPILDMPPIGTLVCGQFCKCYIIYR